jgi:hypothetical protein
MDIWEMIFIGLLPLFGVAVGAFLNYWFSESSKKKESELQIRTDLLDKLNEWWRAYVKVHALVVQLRGPLDINGKSVVYSLIDNAQKDLTAIGWDFLKAWHRASLCLKDESLINSVNELYKEKNNFEKLYGETIPDEDKLSDIEFNKQLENQLKTVYMKMDEARNEILGFSKDGKLRITTQNHQN